MGNAEKLRWLERNHAERMEDLRPPVIWQASAAIAERFLYGPVCRAHWGPDVRGLLVDSMELMWQWPNEGPALLRDQAALTATWKCPPYTAWENYPDFVVDAARFIRYSLEDLPHPTERGGGLRT